MSKELDPMAAGTVDSNESEPKTAAEVHLERAIKNIGKPGKVRTYDDVRLILQENVPSLQKVSNTILAVAAQLLINDVDNPFFVVFQDDPSSGKTQAVNLIKPIRQLSIFLDKMTPKSFVTNVASVKKDDLEEIDLLKNIENGIIVIPDFATLLNGSPEEIGEIVGIITRIMDGEGFKSAGGKHGARGYDRNMLFMALGCTTRLSPDKWRLMAGMGHRIFFQDMGSPSPTIDELVEAMRNPYSFRRRHALCQEMVCDFLRTLWMRYPQGVTWDRQGDDINAQRLIAQFAEFLTHYRGEVFAYHQKDEFGKAVLTHSSPTIEKPWRASQWLYNLARGNALINGRTNVTMEDLPIVARIVFDTAPGLRPLFLRTMLNAKEGLTTTDALADALNIGEVGVKRIAVELSAVGMIKVEKDEGGYYREMNGYMSVPENEFATERPWRIRMDDKCAWVMEERHIDFFKKNELL